MTFTSPKIKTQLMVRSYFRGRFVIISILLFTIC
jgi:hypothetical protein